MTLSWKGKELRSMERVTLDIPKGGDDHNKYAMSSKSICRLLKERIAPLLPLEDSRVTQNSPGIAQPEIEGCEGNSPHRH